MVRETHNLLTCADSSNNTKLVYTHFFVSLSPSTATDRPPTPDLGHLTFTTWWGVKILSIFQRPSFYGLGYMML